MLEACLQALIQDAKIGQFHLVRSHMQNILYYLGTLLVHIQAMQWLLGKPRTPFLFCSLVPSLTHGR